MITSHDALDVAVQPQLPPFVETTIVPVPPAAGIDADSGEIDVTAHAAASCVTVCTCPPAVIVAVRETVAEFEATE